MSKKSNVHPDHYKTDGRDRPDDAARARLNRAIAAKVTSQQRPDRMSKGFYFERPEPAPPEPLEGAPGPAKKKKSPARGRATRKAGARKSAPGKKTAAARPGRGARAVARKGSAPRRRAGKPKTGSTARGKSAARSSRPAKKR